MLVIASFRPFPLKVLPDKVSFSLGDDIFKKSTPSLSFFFYNRSNGNRPEDGHKFIDG
jgi:hypothetical protein